MGTGIVGGVGVVLTLATVAGFMMFSSPQTPSATAPQSVASVANPQTAPVAAGRVDTTPQSRECKLFAIWIEQKNENFI